MAREGVILTASLHAPGDHDKLACDHYGVRSPLCRDPLGEDPQRPGVRMALLAGLDARVGSRSSGGPRPSATLTRRSSRLEGPTPCGSGSISPRPGGVTCVVGLLPQDQPVPVDMLDLVTYEKRIVGSAYGSLDPRVLIPRIADLYLDGRLLLDELVSARLPLEGINRAFDLSRRAEGVRPVLTLVGGPP
jgi:S-(hydroxymethyl)glutathione dehydrogenase/alcohol dehydrogenase